MRKLGVALSTLLLVGLWMGPAFADPPGNNGTVKVDGVVFDDLPDNQPHVGCAFQIDFYGYDEGDLHASMTFELDPPTGPTQTIFSQSGIFIGEDSNAGGGSEEGLDASVDVDLNDEIAATGTEPHPNQGWHIGLTVNADGSQGSDVKHKEFWVTGCGYPPGAQAVGGLTVDSTTPTDDSAVRITWGALAAIVALGALALTVLRRRALAAKRSDD